MRAPLLTLALVACAPDPIVAEPDLLQPGAPLAGVAEGYIDLPIGSPMGGYSDRCRYLGGSTEAPQTSSNYTYAFMPSVGAQTRPMVKALWLENGDQDLVVIKADLIYSYDGLVKDLERQLEAETGRPLTGRVVFTASHSHASFGNFSDQAMFYLGGDRFNAESYQRLLASALRVALDAHDSREPAAIGVGLERDWDPDDAVYSDRRGENDSVQFFDDIDAGPYKDPMLWVLRVDTADGEPLGIFFSFGMHGTTLDSDSPMLSTESTGAVELAVREQFDTPIVVAHLQAGAGDASPRGTDDGYARLETIGAAAAPAILDLWDATRTSADPILLETYSRAIPTGRDELRVTRAGTVDWTYAPYDPDMVPDDELYESSGAVKSPIDEFNVPYGGAFCGSGVDGLSDIGTGSHVYPYDTCVDVTFMAPVIQNWFGLSDFDGTTELTLPLPESTAANTTATELGPVSIRGEDGVVVQDNLLLAFFPGEPTAWYVEQFRRRAAAEVGAEHALLVGYAQDHEGYLLVPEDWLLGGYEPNINVMGPLQGEAIMEGVLAYAAGPLLTDVEEPADPFGDYATTTYRDRPLPELAPDLTPDAGTPLTASPESLWLPLPLDPEVAPAAEVARVQGVVQLQWLGGDPGVDWPTVSLERETGGQWEAVTTPSGRPVTDALPDILLVHTPVSSDETTGEGQHAWWAAWQAVASDGDRAGLPLGTYRLTVQGRRYTGGATTWPWPTEKYTFSSEPFELVAGQVDLSWDASSGTLTASLGAPSGGWRMVDAAGSSTGSNPLSGGTVTWTLADGSESTDSASGTLSGSSTVFSVTPPEGAIRVTVTDAWGNAGTLSL